MTLRDQNKSSVAIFGATGAVGREILSILMERDLEGFDFELIDIAFFSAGQKASVDHAPKAANEGALVIDNTNAFHMDPDSPLIVSQVNGHILKDRPDNGIIANPNCSTIQMIRALGPLDCAFKLNQIFCATYQAASGAGLTGMNELRERSAGCLAEKTLPPPRDFPAELAFNVIPQIDVFQDDGATLEEQKMRQETHKILARCDITVFPFAARVAADNVRVGAALNVVEIEENSRSHGIVPCRTL